PSPRTWALPKKEARSATHNPLPCPPHEGEGIKGIFGASWRIVPWLLLVLAIQIAWANLHSLFVLGLILGGAFGVGAVLEGLFGRGTAGHNRGLWALLLPAGQLAVSLLNPYGQKALELPILI